MKTNKTCMECGKSYLNLHRYKDKFLCYYCYRKKQNIIHQAVGGMSLEKALSKTYEIRPYINNKGNITAVRGFPRALAGHKVKLVLVE